MFNLNKTLPSIQQLMRYEIVFGKMCMNAG